MNSPLPLALLLVATPLLHALQPPPLAAVAAKARKSGALRVLFSGTSITCGTGASDYAHSFPAQITATLEKTLQAKVHGPNICYGGALAVTQLALLKQEGWKWNPDLIVLEAGTLDSFGPDLFLPAIESIFRLTTARGIPLVAIHPYTSYAAGPKNGLLELAAAYSIPIIDVSEIAARKGLKLEELSLDHVHPNNRGQALIRDAFMELLAAPQRPALSPLPARRYAPNLDGVRFLPASSFAPAAKQLPLRRFKGLGRAAEIKEASLDLRTSIAVLLFSFGKTASLEYQLDQQPWTAARSQPGWFLNYELFSTREQAPHKLSLRMQGTAVVEGILVCQ